MADVVSAMGTTLVRATVLMPGKGLDADQVESRAQGWLGARPPADPPGVDVLESGIARAAMTIDGRHVPAGSWIVKLALDADAAAGLADGSRDLTFAGVDLDGRPFEISLADAPQPVAKGRQEVAEGVHMLATRGAVLKADDERRLVGGIVLQPDEADSQGDVVSEGEIELAAHRFMKARVPLGVQHGALAPAGVRPVESYVAPADHVMETPRGPELVRKGSWIVVAHVPDEQLWQRTKAGGFTGWSVAGRGRRSQLEKTTATAPDQARLGDAINVLLSALMPVFQKEEKPAPVFNIHVPAPVIHNHVAIPEQPAANVTVNVPAQPAPVVNVEAPPRAARVKAKRDAFGNTTYEPQYE